MPTFSLLRLLRRLLFTIITYSCSPPQFMPLSQLTSNPGHHRLPSHHRVTPSTSFHYYHIFLYPATATLSSQLIPNPGIVGYLRHNPLLHYYHIHLSLVPNLHMFMPLDWPSTTSQPPFILSLLISPFHPLLPGLTSQSATSIPISSTTSSFLLQSFMPSPKIPTFDPSSGHTIINTSLPMLCCYFRSSNPLYATIIPFTPHRLPYSEYDAWFSSTTILQPSVLYRLGTM